MRLFRYEQKRGAFEAGDAQIELSDARDRYTTDMRLRYQSAISQPGQRAL